MWVKATAAIVALVAMCAIALLWGRWRWRGESAKVEMRIVAPAAPAAAPSAAPAGVAASDLQSRIPATHYDHSRLEGLPAPVQRYFRHVLTDLQPMIRTARVTQIGEIRMGDAEDSWRAFSASELLRGDPPGILWDADVRQAPGLHVYVRDSYAQGVASMRADILGLKTVANAASDRALVDGELQRVLAELVWMPTALLPGGNVSWEAVDDSTAVATLRDGDVRIPVTFRFDAVGEIVGIHVANRGRAVGAANVPTPWEGRFWQYERRDGMLIPIQGEVAWRIDGVLRPYWRGRIVSAVFTFEK